jgi:hypothetical protein
MVPIFSGVEMNWPPTRHIGSQAPPVCTQGKIHSAYVTMFIYCQDQINLGIT